MDTAVTQWLEAIANEELNQEDVDRSLRYAKDLERGLAKIRTFSHGVAISAQHASMQTVNGAN